MPEFLADLSLICMYQAAAADTVTVKRDHLRQKVQKPALGIDFPLIKRR